MKESKNKLIFATLWTVIYSFVFNIIGGVFSANIFDVFLATGWVFLLFLVVTYSRIFFFTIIPTIFISSGIVAYTEGLLGTPVPRDVVVSAFQVNWQEMNGIIGTKLWIWCGFSSFLAVLCMWHFSHLKSQHPWREKIIITTIFLAIFWLCTWIIYPPLNGNMLHWRHPYDYLEYTFNFVREKLAISKLEDKYNISSLPAKYLSAANSRPLQVIVIIGEAARADHFGIYGYSRNTTPLLQKEQNLLVYNDVTSCATTTNVSVPCLMTRATSKNLKPSKIETSFISIFRKLDFKTIWVSEQAKFSGVNTLVASIANEAEKTIFQDNNLTLKLKQFKSYFLDDLRSSNNNELAVFHMMGSHFPYHWMYSPEFHIYEPTCPDVLPQECPNNEIINGYDNSIVFTDYFLKSVIDSLRDKNAIMVYMSDHGEYLGERGMYLHGQETEDSELRHIPMIWWASDEFIKANPKKVTAMRSHLNDKLSHDNIFHSVLDCAGIKSEVIDKSLSICN